MCVCGEEEGGDGMRVHVFKHVSTCMFIVC